MSKFELEVDVVRKRDVRPWREQTHFVSIAVDNQDSLPAMELEARMDAAWMCWHVRGEMVTSVRIVTAEY